MLYNEHNDEHNLFAVMLLFAEAITAASVGESVSVIIRLLLSVWTAVLTSYKLS